MKGFGLGKVRVWFDAKQPCFVLVCGFQVFLRLVGAMHEFGVSLRFWMMVFMVSRVKQSIWKGFRSMEHDFEGFG